jgi:hypothetical protein
MLAGLPQLARAQQEAKFVGWAADGSAVVEDISLGSKVKCKPGKFNAEHAAPQNGCNVCEGKKCNSTPVEPGAASADGKVKAETDPAHHGILHLTVEGEPAPRKLALHATKKAQVTTWFRPDGKALAILVHDAEDVFFIVDLAASSKK